MRLNQGINKSKFKQCCSINFDEYISQQTIKELETSELITNTSDYICATSKGFLVLNKIIEELIYNSPIAINN
ncbi:MAG: coproporphyrinogen III oxidase, partial [Alphaproteobacteria bacterium]|nr:coproporphyrinogen III oxidase [Alphaproteobacteria bacterium]